MFSNFYFYYFLFSRLFAVCMTVGIILTICGTIAFISFYCGKRWCEYAYNKEACNEMFKSKFFRALYIIGIVCFILTIFMPSGDDIIKFTIFKSIDNYTEDNKDSNLSTNGILKNIDSTIDNIKALLENGVQKVTNK
jgi:hypothetical protein